MSGEVVVLGAGPAGLGAALTLGPTATVLEACAEEAGLCRTIEFAGAIFDYGGHSFHTPHPEIRDIVFSALEMEEQTREAWVWFDGDWIRYPFQKHFAQASSPEVRQRCAAGLQTRREGPAADFDAHIGHQFGDGIAEYFMRPYNRKLWGQDLTRLEAGWTAERVAAPAGAPQAAAAQAFALAGGRRTPLQADTKIAYPAQGGFGEIFRALGRRVARKLFGQAAVEIDLSKRRVVTQSGDAFGWDALVSTLPLPRLLGMIRDVPEELTRAVARLEALPIQLFMVALGGRIEDARQRVYNPGDGMPGHKIVLNNTSSRWLRERPRHGIQVEISDADAGVFSEAEMLAGLRRMGLIQPRDEIVETKILRLPLGYPVPTHARRGIAEAAKAWLAERHIFTVGRFGEWAYINADEALFRGVTLGRMLAAGR